MAVTFFGVNTTGVLLMDQASGRPIREVEDAMKEALLRSHKVLMSLAIALH